MKIEDAFEEQWRGILGEAKQAQKAYEQALMSDNGIRSARFAMYAANAAVRRFCEKEREINLGKRL